MADLLSYPLRSTFAREFFQSLTDPKSNDRYYIYYGRPKLWGATVPEAQDTIKEQNDAKRNSLFYQLITPSDVALVVNRYNWVSGTVYDQYEDDVALWSEQKKYYVLVSDGDDYHVYVCLSNNRGAQSTSVPIGTDAEEVITSDGYIWKYLYSLSNELQNFLTNEFMPVVVLDQISYTDERALALNVKANAVSGSIQRVTVDTQGVVFSNLINPSLTENYFVQNVISPLSFTVNIQNLNPNSNFYNTNYVVYFENGQIGTVDTYTVSGSTATIVLCELIGDPIQQGDRYSIVPKVNISGSGTGAVAVARFQNNILTSVDVLNGGQNYGFAEAFFYVQTSAVLSAVIPPDGGHGYDLMTELKPTRILINKQLTYNAVTEEQYFAAGSVLSQYGIVKNLKTTQGIDVSQATNEYDMVLTTAGDSIFTVNGIAENINFTKEITPTSTEVANTFNEIVQVNFFNFNNQTGRGAVVGAVYNAPNPAIYQNFFEVGDIIANRTGTYTGYGEFIGKVIDVQIITAAQDVSFNINGGTRVTFKMISGRTFLTNVRSYNITKNKSLGITGTDYAGNALNIPSSDFNDFTFYTFIRYKNSTGQGFGNQNFGTFFNLSDIVIQKDENYNETYRGEFVGVYEPGLAPPLNAQGFDVPTSYSSLNDTRRCTTVVLKNISGQPGIPSFEDWFEDDGSGNLRQKNCFYNLTANPQSVLLLRSQERLDPANNLTNLIYTKNILIGTDSNFLTNLINSDFILGNESLSIASIKPNTVSIKTDDPTKLIMKITNPSNDFTPASITDAGIVDGETVTFLNRVPSVFTTFSGFESYTSDYMFVLEENYNKVGTENSIQSLNASNIKKIQIKRIGSTVLDNTVIPVSLTGSYLYRESTTTKDSAAGYVLAIGTSQVINGTDSVIDVYYLEEKGTFEIDDSIIIVEDPFVPSIRTIGLGAVTTVTLRCNSLPSSYNNTFVNKYSGEVLYVQNIEPVSLTTDTNFTTRILLGF